MSNDEILQAKLPLLDRILIHFGVAPCRDRNITEAHNTGGALLESNQWYYPHVKMKYDDVYGTWVKEYDEESLTLRES